MFIFSGNKKIELQQPYSPIYVFFHPKSKATTCDSTVMEINLTCMQDYKGDSEQ